jgi:hypothetical protein
MVHRDAAMRGGNRSRRRTEPARVTTVHPGAWAAALEAAGGDTRLIKIVSRTRVIVLDSRYPRR